jgi:2-phosphoglycerate kinase
MDDRHVLARDRQVLLLGGASGVGKTHVSYALARRLSYSVTEIDDLQVMVRRLTTAAQLPYLHFWDTQPERAQLLDEAQLLQHIIAISRELASGVEAVIAHHLRDGPSIVLEGDFLLPELAARGRFEDEPAAGRVHAVFLLEDDEQQLRRNYHAREGDEQARRARASWNFSNWLGAEAQRLGVPTVAARPWDSVLARVIAALNADAQPLTSP